MRFLVLIPLLYGCASAGADDCRRADWYDLGFRDAIFSIQRQDDLYALQCETHGHKVDVTRYAQGWREGKYEAENRNAGSHD